MLESHQRIRDFSVWPESALPRTEAIRKLKRNEIRRWVAEGAPRREPSPQPTVDDIERLLTRYARSQPVSSSTTLNELGLTSLDRIELTMALEDQAGVRVSEAAVAESRTVGDLRRVMDEATQAGPAQEAVAFPRWTRGLLAKTLRNASQALWILPIAQLFLRLRVEGREHLDRARGPVIFAANHQSHLDTPAILISLPYHWRRRVAVAMAKEFFEAHFAPARDGIGERLGIGALYFLAVLFFNAFPLPRSGPGARDTLRYAGELATAGLSILIFPEGHRTEHGEVHPFQPGVGMMASRLRLPVIPVRLEGLDRVLHHTWRWPRRGTVHVRFGAPLQLDGDDYGALARTVEQAVRALLHEPVRSEHPDAA
jgi:long-chain acyl-CoA synthetase